MRTFLRAHWKAIVAIVLLVLLALFTVNPGAAVPGIPLAARLRIHAAAIGPDEPGASTPARRERTARYIGNVLNGAGYVVQRQPGQGGKVEAALSNLAPDGKPARVFIVGAHGGGNAGGTAAVLELARLLKDMRPTLGTEVRFVFFPGDAPDAGRPDAGSPDAGSLDAANFIAFVGGMASARQVQDALSAFRAMPDFPAHGLAAPAYVQGVTLSAHAADGHGATPAVTVTDTGFLRYPYYKMSNMNEDEDGEGAPVQPDAESTARVVEGLARTITALAAGAQG